MAARRSCRRPMSPGGSCIALWRWNDDGAPKLEIVDPDDRLPRSAASWTE